MNKKLIITFSVSIVTVVVIIIAVFYFINQSNIHKSSPDINPNNNNSYYVEKGAEEMAKIVKPAVENYAAQDVTEPSSARNIRLRAYFTPDSPVFGREIEIRSTNSATKTTAKVTAVNYSKGEGDYPSFILKTDITSYSGVNKTTSSQNYWITIKKTADGSYMAYDIGIMVG